LEFVKIGSFDARDADNNGAEFGVALLNLVYGLDDRSQVFIGLLREDEDDARSPLPVVKSDIAQRGALFVAGDGVHIEGPTDLLVRPRLDRVFGHDVADGNHD